MDGIMLLIGIAELLGFTPGLLAGGSLASIFAPGSKGKGILLSLALIGLALWWFLKFPAPHNWVLFTVGAAVGLFGRQH